MDGVSISSLVNLRIGAATSSLKFLATPSRKSKDVQASPSTPAVMEPPDTLEIRSSRGSQPISFKRQRAPTWKRDARKPPPDNARPVHSLTTPSSPNGMSCPPTTVLGWVHGVGAVSPARFVLMIRGHN